MLHKSVIALAAAAALGASSAAIAASSHSIGSSGTRTTVSSSNLGAAGRGPTMSPNVGSPVSPTAKSGQLSQTAPGPSGKTPGTWNQTGPGTWNQQAWMKGHHRHHHRNVFFAFGFAGPYDYGYYDSCWQWVPTRWGTWTRIWVCDYPYPYAY